MHVSSYYLFFSNKVCKKKNDSLIAALCEIRLDRLANTNKYKEAIMDFRQALTLQPSNDQARSYLESTIAQEEHIRLNVSLVISLYANTGRFF